MTRSEGRRDRTKQALRLVQLASVVCAGISAPFLVAAQKDTGSSLKAWTIRDYYADGLFERIYDLTLNDRGLVVISSKQGIGSKEGTACFVASDAQMADIAATLRQLNLTGAPKPVPKKNQKDMWGIPVSSFTVTYVGNTYNLAAEYNTQAQKHLRDLVSLLRTNGEKRIAEMNNGKPAPRDSVPCPANTAAH
jgi:hypothetical protein